MTQAAQYRAGGEAAPAASDANERPGGAAAPEPAARLGPGGRAWSAEHAVNVRLSVPLPVARWYVTILVGRERRSDNRRASERRKHPLTKSGNVAFALAVGSLIGLAVLMAIRMAILAVVSLTGGSVTPG